MEAFSDPATLARLQFAFTACYHFLFVPLSVGFGLIMAILVGRAAKTGDPHDEALSRFWLKIFTGTFAVGVATGITMEFSFGTNWADYSRFVGDIFGAPLAAEALFAFFLESVFLGVLLFGRTRVSKRFYTVSAWLVWLGSCLSALWIIIANSWMQTPAGYEVVDGRAVLTSFLEAAANHSTLQRYLHTVVALLIMGAFVAIAVGAYYRLKGRSARAADRLLRIGVIVGIVTTVLMLPAAHMQAVEVADNQPSKLAAMEGQYETGPVELSLFGFVDEANQETHSLAIPGGTSFLASFDFSRPYPGLNDIPQDEQPQGVNTIFQTYHLMVALFGVIVIVLILGVLEIKGKLAGKRWPLRIMMFGWIAPIAAIECGWITAEFGRQPWIVWGELKTVDAISQSVDATQLLITLVLFAVIYVVLYAGWLRMTLKTIKAGPEAFLPAGAAGADGAVAAAAQGAAAGDGAHAVETVASAQGAAAAADETTTKEA